MGRGKNWSDDEIGRLKRNYSKKRKEELLEDFPRRNWCSILSKANKLGLKRTEMRYKASSESMKEWHKEHECHFDTDNPMKKEKYQQMISEAQSDRELSEETKRRISESKKGTEHSKSFKEKRSERYSGAGNPNFKGWISRVPYPHEWTEELRDSIRRDEDFKCFFCNLSQEASLMLFNRKLAVHHLDGDKNNCKKGNLIPLCNYCHNRVETHGQIFT